MNLMTHLSRWLADEGLDVHQLSDSGVERYLMARRGAGLVIHCGSWAMRPILAYLRGLGVAPTPSIPLPEGPVEVVLEHYRQYLTVDITAFIVACCANGSPAPSPGRLSVRASGLGLQARKGWEAAGSVP